MAKVGLRNALKHSCIENYFSEIDTQEKAYLLGLFVADGCVQHNSGYTFFFSSVDLELVEFFKIYLNATNPIRKRKDGGYEFVVNSKILLDSLSNYGIKERKSLTSTFPKLDVKLQSHFIRGLFDGDGSVRLDKNKNGRFYICGAYPIISEVAKILSNELTLNFPVYKHGNIVKTEISGNFQLLKLKNYLYNNAKLFLKRKSDIFNTIKCRYTHSWKNKNND